MQTSEEKTSVSERLSSNILASMIAGANQDQCGWTDVQSLNFKHAVFIVIEC